MPLTRTELVERLKELAERVPEQDVPIEPIMADCYSPAMPQARFDLAIPCPDCNKTLTLVLQARDFDRKYSTKNFGKQFYEPFPQYPDSGFRIFLSLRELRTRIESGYQPDAHELEFLDFGTKRSCFSIIRM